MLQNTELKQEAELKLMNHLTGEFAFKIRPFDESLTYLQRANCYTLILIDEGSGTVKANFNEYAFAENSLFAFSLFQPFAFDVKEKVSGTVIQFHPDFYCIYMHQKEVACNGVLFNNIYDPPLTTISPADSLGLQQLLQQMQIEMCNPALAQYELLVSYLKIFLITASRIKCSQHETITPALPDKPESQILQTLKDAIEDNYKSIHSPGEYADMLKVPLKALSRMAKMYFNKTLTKLIAERIVIEAKRELYLTDKAIKQIAYELGYPDEYYFSRFFKTNASVSPQFFRDTIGFGKLQGRDF
jgi:AraC-like DNA-binding protein